MLYFYLRWFCNYSNGKHAVDCFQTVCIDSEATSILVAGGSQLNLSSDIQKSSDHSSSSDLETAASSFSPESVFWPSVAIFLGHVVRGTSYDSAGASLGAAEDAAPDWPPLNSNPTAKVVTKSKTTQTEQPNQRSRLQLSLNRRGPLPEPCALICKKAVLLVLTFLNCHFHPSMKVKALPTMRSRWKCKVQVQSRARKMWGLHWSYFIETLIKTVMVAIMCIYCVWSQVWLEMEFSIWTQIKCHFLFDWEWKPYSFCVRNIWEKY